MNQARSAARDEREEFEENAVLRLARRVLPTTEGYEGDRLTAVVDGRRHVTPLVIALLAIGSADVLFAVDSIPAVFGLTHETFLIFTVNAFSLLGLRQLFFLLGGLLDRLVCLGYGLAVILGLIGVKLVVEALHTNELPFVNGEPVTAVPEIRTWLSLVVILVTLLVTTVLSLRKSRRDAARAARAAR